MINASTVVTSRSAIFGFLDIIFCPVCYLKTTLQRLDSLDKILLSWDKLTELVPLSRHQNQHKIGNIQETKHKSSARVKTDITKHHIQGLALMAIYNLTLSSRSAPICVLKSMVVIAKVHRFVHSGI
jgi:hypothetical protein